MTSHQNSYRTRGGVAITRRTHSVEARASVEALIDQLDTRCGVLLSSNYDYPGRYTRWDLGLIDPPLRVTCQGRSFAVEALNARGNVLLKAISDGLADLDVLETLDTRTEQDSSGDGLGTLTTLFGRIHEPTDYFPEEQRSRQPSIFSVLRRITEVFGSGEDEHLGLYGAFGYDLTFQFEPIELRRTRPADQRDLVLFVPDQLLVVDHQRQVAERFDYEFEYAGQRTDGLPRTGTMSSYEPAPNVHSACDHQPGEYAANVSKARESFKRGDLFEVVLSQTFIEPCESQPSAVFRRLRQRNPAPYALLLNLGEQEFLVGASPEMYVRVDQRRVETCPISGTIARGRDAVEDAERIRELLDSRKDESELTMCTDVDRNDKSRICEPGSVRVIGRRQIELYSRLIHTVDHVEGTLREDYDALDAFLSHTWAVTVTGAPKRWAIQRVEDDEKSARSWYGGAIGVIGFDGNLNTGLTLRTVRLKDGRAEVRAGATLLYDSDPVAEERETRVKASAFLEAIQSDADVPARPKPEQPARGKRVLFVDHQDSFVHTLANYIRQTGAEVMTLRAELARQRLDELEPDLVFLSPGPGSPPDFRLNDTIAEALRLERPIFGVCLGLQGLVEYFGGKLGVLDYPMHGKPSEIEVVPATGANGRSPGRVFIDLPERFKAGRYHSLYAIEDALPDCLSVTARTADGTIMGIEHRTLPIAAVQFHPESILTLEGDVGLRLLKNAVCELTRERFD